MGSTDFAERRDDLRQGIEHDEKEVRVAVQQLTGVARSQLDVTERIKKRPLAWALGAFLLGVWLGSRATRADGGRERRST